MPRTLWATAAVLIIALAALLAMALKGGWGPQEPPIPGNSLDIALSVEPFEVGDSVPESWSSSAFAESLATRLSLVPGLRAVVGGKGSSHYSLRGNVAMREGRLILATQLGRDVGRDTVWTATFWRSASASATLLSDLAAAVAEAAVNNKVQESLTPKRQKP